LLFIDISRINEATGTDLKVIERLQQLGWKHAIYGENKSYV